MWRRKGWKNPYAEYHNAFKGIFTVQDAEYEAFEAGADAMLKAIWKLAEESPTKTFTFDKNHFHVYREE